jgi:hypothetical protein
MLSPVPQRQSSVAEWLMEEEAIPLGKRVA